MIKKLSLKLVLVFLILVVSIFITSSCYATSLADTYSYLYTLGGSLVSQGIPLLSISSSEVVYLSFDSNYYCYVKNDGIDDFLGLKISSTSGKFVVNKPGSVYSYDKDSSSWVLVTYSTTQESYEPISSSSIFVIYSETTRDIYLGSTGTTVTDTLIYDWEEVYSSQSVNVTHEFQSDTSARLNFDYSSYGADYVLKYSLTGVEINADLTAPLQLKNPVIYTPGLTNLIVKSNTKVYWALYNLSGECIESDLYQVPKYDSIIENADKDIEYTITYNENSTLATLTVNVVNGEFSDKLYYTENGMISNDYAGKQLFPASKSIEIDHNCNMHIVLYDYFGNLITAKYVTVNQIGLISEENFKVDVTTGDKTVYVRPRLYNVLQSEFYSIEYDVVLDTFTSSKDIDLFQDGVYVGNVTNTPKSYNCGSDSELKFYQNIGTSNITVTFRIINAETGVTCITRTVSFKIGLKDEDTGVTGSTTNGTTDGSFITGSGSSSYSDISNMGIDDYYKLVNTNNTAWSFFKVILNSLPNWITLPLSLLIFGVVIITLYRFIRGA